ncbi:hypothetical protein [Zunongwangia sp. H14]|uniref:hypothetical protein n=1 Tax=Zunongwangia sp. H14 TaxID=3240792 RepID=UPI003561E317
MNSGDEKKEQRIRIPAQSEISHQKILSRSGVIHNNRWISPVAYATVILVQGLFFIYVSTYISNKALRGLGIMAGILVMRICIEFLMNKKSNFPIDEALTQYKQQLISYYRTIKYLYFIMAPLLMAAYIYGFTMLLTIFEQELLGEFYTYVIYLSWIVFFGLAMLTGVQLRKELEILKSLIADIEI